MNDRILEIYVEILETPLSIQIDQESCVTFLEGYKEFVEHNMKQADKFFGPPKEEKEPWQIGLDQEEEETEEDGHILPIYTFQNAENSILCVRLDLIVAVKVYPVPTL
jgi:hypothetical protein